MDYAVTAETIDDIAAHWRELGHALRWGSVFVLPAWLSSWWQSFGAGRDVWLRSIRLGEERIGIAPLMLNGDTAEFIGGADVCDYRDFVVAPGREREFCEALLDHLERQGVGKLDLGPVRPDSVTLRHLAPAAGNRGHRVLSRMEDVSLEMDLPSTWSDYLLRLNAKQRHEVRRKLRRLHEAAQVEYLVHTGVDDVRTGMQTFLRLFAHARADKASFMSSKMAAFFQSMAISMAEIGVLKLCTLEIDHRAVASIICFDYDDTLQLYNSSYDPSLDHLSVGVVCKILSIRDAIERGTRRYDFLKGEEKYKKRLGGSRVELFRCHVSLK